MEELGEAVAHEEDVPWADLEPDEQLRRMRHSAAHVLAEAVLEMFPEGKYAIGPPIENGFYYDFDLPRSLTPEDLANLERRMKRTVKRNVPIEGEWIPKAQAEEIFKDQPYKLELIANLEGDLVGHFKHAKFEDLCRGGHTERTGKLGAFKLTHSAGAYWRGDEKNKMLQRIYGVLFPTQEELDAYLAAREEAERRDHRRVGRELDLFSTHEEYGPGLIYWHPKGGRTRVEIENAWREEHFAADYEIVYTPHVGRATLWETSGHLDFYADSMYSPMDIDGNDYYLKPMNCPFHVQIYKNTKRSYRELPMKLAELGTVYRYERSGVLHGMMRVRGFTQDDAHIICTPEQVEDEIVEVVEFVLHLLRLFGFEEFEASLSTRPEKSVGEQEQWDQAEDSLRRALERAGLEYGVDEGGGAFYGPKIDIHLKDTLGRKWQCSTVQFDFNLPERFDMSYVGEDGADHRPYMVHRALLGSIERFFGILVEHYGGAFPLWLAPVQAIVIPIADRHLDYAAHVQRELKQKGFRVDVDSSGERMGNMIRRAQLQKIPYMLVIGDREAEAEQVAVRDRSGDDLGAMPVFQLVDRMIDERDTRSYQPPI
ncbi:MAG: threonine--tRNA ligase [Chloroflexi bacterium]|nr:threonine--tRNA ligase [Chloroflexota bacterium]MDA1147565.1 threonine--tRNA ligase [Chloroflexota bacterium]MQC83065.1 threonine--tRNA ligase [Chloroflexota bacterium]PKB56705.1 MAG: threonine--tRNA ligase [SAR202 cluster bacterium Casp-Chloro-G1]